VRLPIAWILPLVPLFLAGALVADSSRSRFEVRSASRLDGADLSGRLVLILSATNQPEPIQQVGSPSMSGPSLLGIDAAGIHSRKPAEVTGVATPFPQAGMADIPAGSRWVQAVLMTNRDLRLLDAPGNLVSEPVRIEFDPRRSQTHRIVLSRALDAERLPPDTERVHHLRFHSDTLSAFYGRPIDLRASVLLPRTFATEATRKFPLVVDIGGFGSRYDRYDRAMREGTAFRKDWDALDTPQMLVLALDGAGPHGDPYQVNSDNHGPYGDAVIRELIPHVEQAYRALGQPWARFTTGGSTGGWVSLALQTLYPGFFGGCWSGFPDGVDFRAFQLVNIYEHTNAFVNPAGFERPSARTLAGDVDFTMRFEVAMENVLGDGGSYANGGGQWGSWNAVYSPRSPAGRAVPLWDPKTGTLDRSITGSWQRYDLRMQMEKNWPAIGPQLKGKIHVWVGESDQYFLNNAVHLLDGFLQKAEPPAAAEIRYGPGQGHGWNPESYVGRLQRMQASVEAMAPKGEDSGRDAYFRSRFLHGGTCPHCKGGR